MLRQHSPDEILALYRNALSQDWFSLHKTLDQVADLIASKVIPSDQDEHYPWMASDRAELSTKYREHIRTCVLSGAVPYFSPHTKVRFNSSQLTPERFPADGLIAVGDIYLCLMFKDAASGYFPRPAKAVTKVPPPISPLESKYPSTLTSTRSCPPEADAPTFRKPDWSRWSRLDRVYLWEAACLAANIDPPRPRTGDIAHLFELQHFPVAFFEVWEVMNRDAVISTFDMVGTSGRMLHTVALDEFATWATNKGMEVTPEMLKLAERFNAKHDAYGGDLSPTVKPTNLPPAAGHSDKSDSVGGVEWEPEARALGMQYVADWEQAGFGPTVADAALFVEGRFSTMGKLGKKQNFLDQETIRKALAGITGRKAGKRLATKKIPKNLREKLPNELGGAQLVPAAPNQK